MRITTRLSTAAEAGFMAMPMLPKRGELYATEDGGIDSAAVRRDLAKTQGVQFASSDDDSVIAFAVELLDRMRISFDRMMSADTGVRRTVSGEMRGAAERRYDKGRVTFVRVDIRRSRGQIVVRVSAANPREVVGSAEEFARTFAQSWADNAVAIRDDLAERGCAVALEDGDGCAGIFAEAERRVRFAAERAAKWDCDSRRNGYCSPCQPGCAFYEQGKCKWR